MFKQILALKQLFFRSGDLSHSKTLNILTWIIGTYGYLYMLHHGTLTDEYAIGYLSIFVLNAVGSSATNAYQKRATYQNNRNIKVDNPDD